MGQRSSSGHDMFDIIRKGLSQGINTWSIKNYLSNLKTNGMFQKKIKGQGHELKTYIKKGLSWGTNISKSCVTAFKSHDQL